MAGARVAAGISDEVKSWLPVRQNDRNPYFSSPSDGFQQNHCTVCGRRGAGFLDGAEDETDEVGGSAVFPLDERVGETGVA